MRRFVLFVAGLTLLAGVAATVSGGATQAEASWVITDLGPHSAVAINDRGQVLTVGVGTWLWENGKTRSLRPLVSGSDLNEHGSVVGTIKVKGDERAALWVDGRARNLGTLSGKQCLWTEAIALNDRGQVIGSDVARREDSIWRGFLWTKGKMIDLGDLGVPHTTPIAINNRGQIVGIGSSASRDGNHGFLWENGGMIDLGRMDRDEISLNDRGQVVFARDGRVVLLERGGTRTLPTLGKSASAFDITEQGTIVGSCAVKGNLAHPCMWQDGTVRDLGTVFGDRGRALAANDRGQVVGFTMQLGEGEHAFVWENGTMTDLGTPPGGKASSAIAINNRGQIVGWAEMKKGDRELGRLRAVLWTLKP